MGIRRIRGLGARVLFVLVASALLPVGAAAQGESGFLRGKGRWLVGYTYQEATFEERLAIGGGSTLPIDRRLMSLYVNVGLTDDLDVVVQPLYQRADFPTRPNVEDEEGLTDVELYLKWRVWEREVGPGRLSMLLEPGMLTDLQSYTETGFLGLGAGQTDWRARGILHYVPRAGGWWGSVESGYDFRSGAPRDYLVIRAHVGVQLGPVTLQPFYDVLDARGGQEPLGTVTIGSPAASGRDYDVWGMKAYLGLNEHVGLFGSVFNFDDDREKGVVSGTSFGLVVIG